MWNYVITLLIGVAIPLVIYWLQDKQKRKYFDLERKEKFKMVEIEKRLATHQQAIKHWHLLSLVIHNDNDDEKLKVISNAREFWLNNCLYMEKRTREKFSVGINIVSNYRMLLNANKTLPLGKQKEENTKVYLQQWNDFYKLFEIIQEDVELEPIQIGQDKTPEGKPIKKNLKVKMNASSK